ncbi:hypothetical protein MNBD_GAMMA01-66 [hydrothermal vent metagenome]|uniref:Uncharacterized protein n=1 Tax=hydrothermal vent metagenome TaxID=652676 RepID=A0A3B0UQM1_9ZZZZ
MVVFIMKNKITLVLILLSGLVFADDIFINEFEQNIAIRVSQSDIVDPHLYVLLFGILCTDITAEVNTQIQSSIDTDSDADGFLDNNIITQFSSDQPAYITSRNLTVDFIDGNCPDPLHSSACETTQVQQADIGTDFNLADTCLQPFAGTASSYSPAPNITTGPCYSTSPITTTFNLAGIDVAFQGYQQAARYPGNLNLDNGLRMGFISEVDAENVVFSADTPIVGGQTLASLLSGGAGNCSSNDDRDLFTDNVTTGWWFYFNTTSELIELQ